MATEGVRLTSFYASTGASMWPYQPIPLTVLLRRIRGLRKTLMGRNGAFDVKAFVQKNSFERLI